MRKMNSSRTEMAMRNSIVTTICQIVYLVTNFVGRTILAKQMGAEYLGINGLFSNILMLLSFAELGLGSTLVFRMYKPLATGNREKLVAYVNLYKKIYRVIIFIIAFCGVAVIPFLNYIVEAPNIKENLFLLYTLYLTDTVISYAFVYKKSILIADQKSYIVAVFTQVFNIFMNVGQCTILLITHNFSMYLLVKIVCDLLNNIFCSAYAQKVYPYITEKTRYRIEKEEIDELKSDTKGLILTKIADTTFSGTDNIFISKFIGIRYVGILSNYMLILSAVNTILNNIFNAITASLGNLNVTGNTKQMETVLNRLFFINTSMYGYIVIGMLLLIREFVTEIWLNETYYLSTDIVILSIIELFYRSIHYPLHIVRNAMGFFSQYKIWYAGAAVLNVLLDFFLVTPMGIAGLLVATLFCRGITYAVDIYVVYKNGFHQSPMSYVKKLLGWSVYLTCIYIILSTVLTYVKSEGITGFCFRILIISIVYFVSYIFIFRKNENFTYAKEIAYKLTKSIC